MKKSNGFTLIELIIVVTIIGVIAGVVGFILLGAVDAWTFKFNRADILADGRLAMNRMVREIREIKILTSVTTATSSEFRFTIDDSGSDVDITYELDGTDLDRTEDGTTNVLAQDVSALSFTYYDSDGDTISSPAVNPSETDIRRVQVDLTLAKNGENVYLRSQSIPRNF
jgi:prepilin-type N-terminal cleavage/methylation domain-containing protein